MPSRSFPSFTSALSSNNAFDLPDYYRTTRIEEYGPYYRSPTEPQDFMKRIDPRSDSREFTASFLLPDIPEEIELNSSDANHETNAAAAQKRPSCTRVLSRIWRKCRLRKFLAHLGSNHHADSRINPAAKNHKNHTTKAQRRSPTRFEYLNEFEAPGPES